MSFSQCQDLEFMFNGYFPPFNIRAEVFDTSFSFFFCQALTCRSPSNIKDGGNMIENHCLGDIKVTFHHVSDISRVPFQFGKSLASSLGSLMNCNQQTISLNTFCHDPGVASRSPHLFAPDGSQNILGLGFLHHMLPLSSILMPSY